jgi:phosphate transport system substrate-binding protein
MDIEGKISGSIYWISPEQLNQEPVDARSDLYALGCTFYFALAGRHPFDGEKMGDVIAAHLTHRVIPLETYRPDLPAILCQWVMSLINRQPDHRYQSSLLALNAFQSVVIPQLAVRPITPLSQTGIIAVPLVTASTTGGIPTAYGMPPVNTGGIPSGPQMVQQAPPPEPERKGNWAVALLAVASVLALIFAGIVVFKGVRHGPDRATSRFAESDRALIERPAYIGRSDESAATNSRAVDPADAPGEGPAERAPAVAVEPTPRTEPVEPKVEPAVAAQPPQETGGGTAPAAAPEPAPSESAAAEPAPAPIPVQIVFRLKGSNTIGAALAPALLEEFLKREGAKEIRREPGNNHEEVTVEALFPGQTARQAVAIAAHGSSTAFSELMAGGADIGMSSRPVKGEEVEKMAAAGLGDMLTPACEHVVGLDGIAVIVNPANPVHHLTKNQIADLFTGKVTDWASVGGNAGPIRLYGRDDKSGTFDSFKSMVLGKAEISGEAKRYEDSALLSDDVASDVGGIGFIGLPYVRNAKAVAVSDRGGAPLIPTPFTVATEDYALARRLFLYTPVTAANPLTRKFVEFALSDEGQAVVDRVGFIKQSIELERPSVPEGAPANYTAATEAADRMSLSFRFRPGSSQLDTKSLRDLERVTRLLAQPTYKNRKLMLFGFSDSTGSADANIRLSQQRADAVAQELAMRGIRPASIKGLGPVLAIASNDDETGREKNRRVEVWLR